MMVMNSCGFKYDYEGSKDMQLEFPVSAWKILKCIRVEGLNHKSDSLSHLFVWSPYWL